MRVALTILALLSLLGVTGRAAADDYLVTLRVDNTKSSGAAWDGTETTLGYSRGGGTSEQRSSGGRSEGSRSTWSLNLGGLIGGVQSHVSAQFANPDPRLCIVRTDGGVRTTCTPEFGRDNYCANRTLCEYPSIDLPAQRPFGVIILDEDLQMHDVIETFIVVDRPTRDTDPLMRIISAEIETVVRSLVPSELQRDAQALGLLRLPPYPTMRWQRCNADSGGTEGCRLEQSQIVFESY